MEAPARRALELVVFRLNEGVSPDDFLRSNDAVAAWISRQPGFVSRDLSYDAEGDRWIDVIWWESMDEARRAADLALTAESCAPMFALIDPESSLMLHAEPAAAPVYASTPVAA